MIGFDYVGVGTLITTTGAVVVSIIVAFRQTGTRSAINEVHDAVKTANGSTLGQRSDQAELRRVIDEAHEGKV